MSLPPVASPAVRDDRVPRPAASEATIAVQHVRIEAASDIETVKAALESLVPPVDPAVAASLRAGDRDRVAWQETHGAKLSIFVVRDHGSFLAVAGRARKAYQYEIGNPITASRMTRHDIRAGLYAPLRVMLYEDDWGRAVFEYDQPSSLFGQFGDDRVTAVARELDDELKAVLLRAAA
ncbi:DUF302 domain-containing protein [Hypericibacter sp.]|uniref:DUF302 domain-containing protein n=1 Tax=Hypericibacter sp. TaxID=2705401 RepID=UPI003D6D7F0C